MRSSFSYTRDPKVTPHAQQDAPLAGNPYLDRHHRCSPRAEHARSRRELGAYGKTNFLFFGPHNGCESDCWYSKTIQSTGEYDYYHTPIAMDLASRLEPFASKARGDSYVCVQLGWPVPDACSYHAYPSFDY